MGNCLHTDPVTRELDRKMTEEQQKEDRTSKLLFLGAGGGGKSTMFKQLGYIYNGSYNVKFDKLLTQKIYTQIIEQMQTAIEISINPNQLQENNKFTECIEMIQEYEQRSKLPLNVANAIQFIWQNSKILQSVMAQIKHKRLEETTIYFWNGLERIKQANYIPNDMDFLHLRQKTTGISQRRFEINGRKFHIFDVGGQVSERKKWINCFDNVTALLFVVGLSSYNQTMYEDSSKNCMQDSMQIFQDVCNDKIFKKSHLILFFNKTDIFKEKIKNIGITVCPAFKDFFETENEETDQLCDNKYDYAQCATYIKQKYNILNHTNKIIYTHFTCAMQKKNISNVFSDVQNIILMEQSKHIVSFHDTFQ